MDEHHSWYNGSVWHIDWPYQVYVGQCPVFYGPAILLHFLNTIWWRNVVIWDNGSVWLKDRPCKMYVDQWHIFHGPLILPYIIVRLKLFLCIKKWHRPGVFVPLRALALVLRAMSYRLPLPMNFFGHRFLVVQWIAIFWGAILYPLNRWITCRSKK